MFELLFLETVSKERDVCSFGQFDNSAGQLGPLFCSWKSVRKLANAKERYF